MCGCQCLQQINGDTADAARWRIFCLETGWNGGAAEAATRYNEMVAALAQYQSESAALCDLTKLLLGKQGVAPEAWNVMRPMPTKERDV